MSDEVKNDDAMDLLAAEYVLGTLDAEERSHAQSLLTIDHGYAAMVKLWERRLGELHLMVETVEPPPQILEKLKARVAAGPQPAPLPKPVTEGAEPAAEGAAEGAAPSEDSALGHEFDLLAEREPEAVQRRPMLATGAEP